MKFKFRIGVAVAAIGCGASPALAAPGQSLDEAINSLLSDGCGAGGTGQRLLSSGDFSKVSMFTPRGAPTLDEFQILRRPQGGTDYSGVQTGGFVDNWRAAGVVTPSLSGDPIAPRSESEIAYRLNIDVPEGPDHTEDSPEILAGFDPQNFAGTNLEEEHQENQFNINDVRIRATISQNFDVRTSYTPNAQIGTGLASLCTGTALAANQPRTDTYDFDFQFNNQPGARSVAGSVGGLGGIGTASPTPSGTRGLAAIQAQEGVARRQGGLTSLIDRLSRKAKQERRREAAQRSYQIASLDAVGPPNSAPPRTASASIVFDASAGILNVDRSETALEGSFSAESVVANLGGAVVFAGPFQSDDQALLGLGVNFERTKSDRADGLAINTSSFESDAVTISAFIGWTSEALGSPDSPATVSTMFSVAYGTGDQSYGRRFNFYRDRATISPGSAPDASNTLEGDVDQTFTSVSAQASYTKAYGAVSLQPRISATFVRFETEGHKESVRAGEQDNGFALEYAPVEDEWAEVRVGGTVAYTGQLSERALWQVALGVDSVFVLDAETPDRTAFFVQDLRQAGRVPIIYSVDNLDDQYYDMTVSVSGSFENGLQPSMSFFTRQGHEYIEAHGVLVGLRLVL